MVGCECSEPLPAWCGWVVDDQTKLKMPAVWTEQSIVFYILRIWDLGGNCTTSSAFNQISDFCLAFPFLVTEHLVHKHTVSSNRIYTKSNPKSEAKNNTTGFFGTSKWHRFCQKEAKFHHFLSNCWKHDGVLDTFAKTWQSLWSTPMHTDQTEDEWNHVEEKSGSETCFEDTDRPSSHLIERRERKIEARGYPNKSGVGMHTAAVQAIAGVLAGPVRIGSAKRRWPPVTN